MKQFIKKVLDSVHLGAISYKFYRSLKYRMNIPLQIKNVRFKHQGASDGLPLPSPHMVFLISNQYDVKKIYDTGIVGVKWIKSILDKNGIAIDKLRSILDFGCGWGRIIRKWGELETTELHGTDYNPLLVKWGQKNLPFARFTTNKLDSKSDYEDEQFDFIYAISVFTHLTEKLQHFWMNELTRILKPKGFLIITTHGIPTLRDLTEEQKQQFEAGYMVVRGKKYPGTSVCGVYHPEQYVRENLIKNLILLDYIEGGAKEGSQDIYLLQKP